MAPLQPTLVAVTTTRVYTDMDLDGPETISTTRTDVARKVFGYFAKVRITSYG